MKYQIQNQNQFFGLTTRRIMRLVILLIVIFLALGIVALVYVDSKTKDQVPIINITDNNGMWEGQKEIEVFDDVVNPGSSGAYSFIIANDNQVKLIYSFSINQFYNNELVEEFPILYRLKMNNQYLGSENWVECDQLHYNDFVFLPDSKQEFTLEWNWPFEGNNYLDTYFGDQGGEYHIKIDVSAQVYEE